MKDFTELIDDFINESQISASSQKTYFAVLKLFYIWFNQKNGMQWYELKTTHLLKWKQDLEENRSPLTVSTYLTIVKMFYRFMEENAYSKNIAAKIKIPAKYKGYRKFPLSIPNIEKLLNAIDQTTLMGKRDFALVNLLLRNGLRIIEAQRINIEDITMINDRHVIHLQRKGKKDRSDFVVLSDKGLKAIHDYLAALPKLKNENPLFISLSNNGYSGRMATKSMSHIIKSYLNKIGLTQKQYTAHSLRHTAGVLALKNKSSEYATQIYLGHANFATTQLYTRAVESEILLNSNPALLTDKIY